MKRSDIQVGVHYVATVLGAPSVVLVKSLSAAVAIVALCPTINVVLPFASLRRPLASAPDDLLREWIAQASNFVEANPHLGPFTTAIHQLGVVRDELFRRNSPASP